VCKAYSWLSIFDSRPKKLIAGGVDEKKFESKCGKEQVIKICTQKQPRGWRSQDGNFAQSHCPPAEHNFVRFEYITIQIHKQDYGAECASTLVLDALSV
jgi:hypothetical protein